MSKSFYSTLAFLLLACSGDKDTGDGITNPEAFDVDQDGLTDIWVAGGGTTVSLLLGKYIQ